MLKGRTILITGGTSGIGFELAAALRDRGNVVIVTGRRAEGLAAVKRDLPGVHAIRSDVSDAESIRTLYAEISDRFPAIDTLINNAGIMRKLKLTQDRSLEDVTSEIDIDLAGPIRMVQQFLPLLKRQPDALIVNISSGLAFVPFAISPVYSAAKAAMHAYTRCLRVQLEGSPIKVVELAPPLTQTPLFTNEFAADMKGQQGMATSTLVRKAIAGIERGREEIRPGQSNILKIASRLAPGLIFQQLSKVGRS